MKAPIDKVVHAPESVAHKLSASKDSAFKRYPLLFTALTLVGLTITEGGIQNLPFVGNHPLAVAVGGLVLLAATGTLYKSL